jgi:putative transposase
MDVRSPSTGQWRFYDRQTGVAKRRAMDRLHIITEIETMVEAGISKSAAVASLAQSKKISASSIWNWLRAVANVPIYDRLSYLVPRFRGGGRPADIADEILEAIAADYFRPEKPSWAECVRRMSVSAKEHGIVLPHARTLWRRLRRIYIASTIVCHRSENLSVGLHMRIPANDR